MTSPTGLIRVGTAYLIALFAADVPIQVIDFFGLQVPRMLLGMPWSTMLGIAVLLILLPVSRFKGIPLIGWGGVGALAVLFFWLVLEAVHYVQGGTANPTLVLSFLPAVLVSQIVRIHRCIFADSSKVIDAFVNTVVALAAIHLVLLSAVMSGFQLSFVNNEELFSRNSVSLLLVVAIWIVGLLDDRRSSIFGFRFSGLAVLTIMHIVLNHARGAGILLFLTLILISSRNWIPGNARFWPLALAGCGIVAATAALSFPLLEYFAAFSWAGSEDAALSVRFRSESNWLLMNSLWETPLAGGGWNGVLAVKSGGYISHTLQMVILAAYGLIGTLVALLWVGTWFYVISMYQRVILSLTLLLVMVTASFSNDPMAWYGLVLALVSTSWKAGTWRHSEN